VPERKGVVVFEVPDAQASFESDHDESVKLDGWPEVQVAIVDEAKASTVRWAALRDVPKEDKVEKEIKVTASSPPVPYLLEKDDELPPEELGSLLTVADTGARGVEVEKAEEFALLEQAEEKRRKQQVRQTVWARALKLRKGREESERKEKA
jgi:hypothetical protein